MRPIPQGAQPKVLDDPKSGDRLRHYKGGLYEFIAFASHTETDEQLVAYRSLADARVWVRPRAMFFEDVETADGLVPRFAPD